MNQNPDSFYMTKALSLARFGIGYVSPNPLVGALIVKDGKIIGKGYHGRYGGFHAEVEAIESATLSVAGATLYCNLEPCCHLDKKTPPCAQRIIKEKIKRVVLADLDPNPKVNGKGIRMLQDAGIEVVLGIKKDQHQELNRFYIKYIVQRRPYVTVKIAQTIDAKISKDRVHQTWITGDISLKKVHRWRSAYDAVLIGANTVRSDHPQLTVRAVKGRNPKRIIVSKSLNLPKNEFYKGPTTIIFTGVNSKLNFTDPTSKIIRINEIKNGILPLSAVMKHLGELDFTSVLIEGGNKIFSQFIFNQLADEVKVFIAPVIWGKGIPVVDSTNNISEEYTLKRIQRCGQDVLLTYRKRFFRI